MKNTKTKLAVAICCLGSLAAANVGQAALTQIYVTSNSGVGGLTSTAYDSTYGNASSGWAGSWDAKITGGFIPSGAPALNATWQSFCMDIGNSMGSGQTYNYTASTFSSGNPPANDPPDPRWVAGGGSKAGYLYGLYNGVATTATLRSALAIAIWEVLYESSGTYSVSDSISLHNPTKGFAVISDGSNPANNAIAQANAWLTAAGSFAGAPNTTWWKESVELGDPQSLIGGISAVPEPSTYVAGGLLLLPFLFSTIRRRLKVS